MAINPDVEGKKVRINLDGTLSLAEVEIYGTSHGQLATNLALAGTASQSSTDYGGEPERAIDNDTNGSWSNGSVTHTANLDGSWWQVELSTNSQIEQIVLFNRTDTCCRARLADYTVAVLDQNGDVTWSQTYAQPPAPSQLINLSATGKFVRVSLDGFLSLAEVRVMGYAL